MKKEIKFLKNNDGKDWSDLEWVEEFYRFLKGWKIDNITTRKIKLSSKKAFTIIWYLQEHFSILPDNIEACSICNDLYNSDSEGYYSELTSKHYCAGCMPYNIIEREERAEKRKDAPFRKWLKLVKKEQNNYPLFKGKQLNEPPLRRLFEEGKTPIDALNDLITLT